MNMIGQNNSKIRVICLYRVSTKKQVHRRYLDDDGSNKYEDDIPLQRLACQNFVKGKENWEIVDEKFEKGVSGSKVSADKRDAIQELKELALGNKFEVLLVWKFDRLGRIEDETPFVLKWFVLSGGVQVWSTIEGQRLFENSVDELINYITFWQAGTESKNTALRIKERMQQLIAEGIYTGGKVPLGFKTVQNGRLNKKGQPIPDVEIDEEIASIVREKIFYKAHNEGWGAYTITKQLKVDGIMNSDGRIICPSSVKRILRNERYRGTIVEEDVFDRVQTILSQRADSNNEARRYNLSNRGQALLTANIFCGHCGSRMVARMDYNKWVTKEGMRRSSSTLKYACNQSYHRYTTTTKCDGQSIYTANVIDDVVEEVIKNLFAELTDLPQESVLRERFEAHILSSRSEKAKLEKALHKDKINLGKLEQEVVKSIIGESNFSPELINKQIQTLQNKTEAMSREIEKIVDELADNKRSMHEFKVVYERFRSWSEEFGKLSIERKRIIACELIDRVEVKKGYDIKIVFNVQYEQFCRPLHDELRLLKA